MTKIKKFSINSFEKIMKDTYEPTETFEWHGESVTVTRALDFNDMVSFVNEVVDSCFTDDGTYLPEAKEFAIKICILEKYGNFNIPTNNKNTYTLIYCTDAVSEVVKHINTTQLHDIINAIDEKIEKRVTANIEALHRQMSDVAAAFDNIQQQLSKIYDGIDSDELKNVLEAVTGGTFSEEKLVKAYLDQTNSDTEKKD